MKKNIGPVVGLYPTPVTIVGTVIEGKINWVNIAHVGLIGLDRVMVSINKSHYSNEGISENKTVSVNLVTEEMMVRADYVGLVSGRNTDKSEVFEYFNGELEHAPMIKDSPVSMECEVVFNYETEQHNHYILKVINTYANDSVLDEAGKLDYEKVKPILFEMPTRSYYSLGKKLAKCWHVGKNFKIRD